MRPSTGTRGILHPRAAQEAFALHRYSPTLHTEGHVERLWVVRWSLPVGRVHEPRLIANPCVNLTIEDRAHGLHGVPAGAGTRRLEGSGRAVGVKLRPGAASALFPGAVAALTGRTLPLDEVFGAEADALVAEVRAEHDDERAARRFERFLAERLPSTPTAPVATAVRVARIVLEHPEITRVDALAARTGMSERALQRLFRAHVGISPKRMLVRARAQRAAESLERGERVDLAALAAELGYADQAHFCRDFAAEVGESPLAYARQG